ncbi:MAG: glycosyltransferase [Kiritimatiellae bacterium]|nr:glycosyltransferase [Kiritimatiellia bacterium]
MSDATSAEASKRLSVVERVVLDPGDPTLCNLKARFDAGRLKWATYCFLWRLRKCFLRFRCNSSDVRSAVGTSFRQLVDSAKVPEGAIPVIINNFNRLDSLRTLIQWLQHLDTPVWIVILDNASSYEPLLAYYRDLVGTAGVSVVRLGYNSGLEGVQDAAQDLSVCENIVVTDPDLVPYATTPTDILGRMHEALVKYPEVNMVGASLEIKDIPETYPLREKVLAWESRFWEPQAARVGDIGVEAWVDTTFAMYRRSADVLAITPAMRLDRPYTLKHVDWYTDPSNMSDEQAHYARVSQPIASWTARAAKADA